MGRPVLFPAAARLLPGLLLLALCLSAPAFAQATDGVDDMFDDPNAGIVEQPEEGLDVDALTADKKPRFSGSATVGGGFVLGMARWENPFADPGVIALTPFYVMEGGLKLDYRPVSSLRLYGAFEVNSPYVDPAHPNDTSIAFSPVLVEELFLDYTLAEKLFFRMGKQEITWGQGRLFNPGDFLLQAIDGISVKGFLPLGPNGLTLVGLGEGVFGTSLPTYYDNLSELIAAAGQFESSLSRLAFGLSAYYRIDPGLRTGAYLKTPIAGVDLALEGVLEWGPNPTGVDSAAVLAGLFWEGGRHKWQLILEYLFDTSVPDYLGHSAGLGILASNWLPGGWKPGLRWVHSFADVSGQILLGLEGPIAPYLRLAVAFPFRYGDTPGNYSRYLVTELPGIEYLERIEDGRIPGDPAAALLVMLTLSINF